MAVDWTNACERAAVLKDAYFRLISGQQEWEFEYESNEGKRRVSYSRGDVAVLRRELTAAEAECAGLTGVNAPVRTQVARSNKGWL